MVKKRQEREMRKRSLMFALCFARCHMAHSQVALIAVFQSAAHWAWIMRFEPLVSHMTPGITTAP